MQKSVKNKKTASPNQMLTIHNKYDIIYNKKVCTMPNRLKGD